MWLPLSRNFSVASHLASELKSSSRALLTAVFGCNLREHLRHNKCQTADTPLNAQPRNASAPTEPVSALHSENSDRSPKRETIKGPVSDVKERRAEFHCRELFELYKSRFTKYTTPITTPPRTANSTTAIAATANLNFLYLFSSAGESELCGKYGGGV